MAPHAGTPPMNTTIPVAENRRTARIPCWHGAVPAYRWGRSARCTTARPRSPADAGPGEHSDDPQEERDAAEATITEPAVISMPASSMTRSRPILFDTGPANYAPIAAPISAIAVTISLTPSPMSVRI